MNEYISRVLGLIHKLFRRHKSEDKEIGMLLISRQPDKTKLSGYSATLLSELKTL